MHDRKLWQSFVRAAFIAIPVEVIVLANDPDYALILPGVLALAGLLLWSQGSSRGLPERVVRGAEDWMYSRAAARLPVEPAEEPEPEPTAEERMQQVLNDYNADSARAMMLPDGDARDTALAAAEGRLRKRMRALGG